MKEHGLWPSFIYTAVSNPSIIAVMRRPIKSSGKVKHLLHVVEAVAALLQEARGAQRAVGVGGAAGRAMRNLDALASAGEQNRVVADHVAAANRRKPDARRLAFAGNALAVVDRVLGEIASQRGGGDLAQAQCR